MVLAGTFFVITLPAPIKAFSPIVIPGRTVEFAPIDAPFLTKVLCSLKFLFFDLGNKSFHKKLALTPDFCKFFC